MVYAPNFEHDGCHNEILSSEEESCCVFDPDELDSSSNLSFFLTRYEKGDWTPDDELMTKAWKRSSVYEAEEENKVPAPDNGYITR